MHSSNTIGPTIYVQCDRCILCVTKMTEFSTDLCDDFLHGVQRGLTGKSPVLSKKDKSCRYSLYRDDLCTFIFITHIFFLPKKGQWCIGARALCIFLQVDNKADNDKIPYLSFCVFFVFFYYQASQDASSFSNDFMWGVAVLSTR